jgi:hypothetical protein
LAGLSSRSPFDLSFSSTPPGLLTTALAKIDPEKSAV